MSNTPQNLSRRKFLSGSALALSSIGIPRLPVQPEPLLAAAPAGPQAGRAPISRTLGKTGLRVPIVNMGVMNADNPAVVQQSYEIGVRLFDTALGYQGGRNEEMIGSVIKNLGVRDKVIIQTKIPVPRTGMGLFSASAAQATSRILSYFERCLKRLQTNYVDVLLMHQPSVSQINEPGVMKALSEAKRQGRAHFIGFSAHGGQAEILNDAARSQFYDVALVAFNFTNAGDTAIPEAIRNASAKGIGIIAMKTQASGRRFPGSRAVNQTAALKWVLNHTEVTTAIPGYTNFEHMKEDFSVAYSLDYTAEEKEFLADKNIRAEAQYCKQCGKCLKTCPNGVDIPSLMRCHMYAASYGNFYQARVTLDEIEENRHLRRCGSCSRCSARCSESLDLARNIEDLRTTYL